MSDTQPLTCVFKLHNPTAWRRDLLDRAFISYTEEMTRLLDWSRNNLDDLKQWGNRYVNRETGEIKEVGYKQKIIMGLLPRPDGINCLKDPLTQNVAKMLASYLELDKGEKQEAGFPVCRDPSPDSYPNALELLTTVFLDNTIGVEKDQAEQVENEARARLMKVARGSVMPIELCRARDCQLLFHPGRKRLYAYVKLAEADNSPRPLKGKGLVDVNTGKAVEKSSKTTILFPLELGQRGYQYEKFIKPVLADQARYTTSRLVKKEDGYYLHTVFQFDIPDSYEPQAYLGIDRGVFFSVAYGLVDAEGRILQMGHKQDGFRTERIQAGQRVQKKQRKGKPVTVKDYRGQRLDDILHVLVNQMVELAKAHRAMIVLEDLNIRIRGKFYKSAWKKLHGIFEYKSRLAGVPFKKEGVWAAYTSQICIACGERNPDRKRGEDFHCSNCGVVYHSDEGAGVNIARRALYRKSDWGGGKDKAGDYWAFHRSFANGAGLGAEIDLRREAVIKQLELF